jgi:single-stranded-DNA-specific exonuclease
MTHARHIFQDFGGHESSGGFSIAAEAIHQLPVALEEALARIGLSETTIAPQNHAGILTLAEVNDRTYNALREMSPFGMENPKPIFRFTGITVDRVLHFGGSKEHVRLALSDDTGADAEAIAFFINRSSFKDDINLLSTGDRITLDATMDRSFFGGCPSLRLRIENLKTMSV